MEVIKIIESFLYTFGTILGFWGLFFAIQSIIKTRQDSVKDFIERHKEDLKRHNHLPKE